MLLMKHIVNFNFTAIATNQVTHNTSNTNCTCV